MSKLPHLRAQITAQDHAWPGNAINYAVRQEKLVRTPDPLSAFLEGLGTGHLDKLMAWVCDLMHERLGGYGTDIVSCPAHAPPGEKRSGE